MRGEEDLPSWKLALRPGEKIRLGGTSAEETPLILSWPIAVQLAELGAGVLFPISMKMHEDTLRYNLQTCIDAGVRLTDVGYGNEIANKPDLVGVPLSKVPAAARSMVDAYLGKCASFDKIVDSMVTVQKVYSSVYPHPDRYPDPENNKTYVWKREWARYLDEKLPQGAAIDVHVYDPGTHVGMEEGNLVEFLRSFSRPVYVGESGAIPQGDIPDADRSDRIWDICHNALGAKDEFGVQLMEQVNFGFGLVYKGQLTRWGEKYLSLPRKSRPRAVAARKWFGFGPWVWWVVKDSQAAERIIFGQYPPIPGSVL